MHPALIEREALLRYLNDPQNDAGITTLFAYGDITELPRSCKTIVQSDTSRTGFYIRNENKNLPAIVVLLDHYAAFREKYMDLSDQFAQLIAAGSTLGVYFVITGTIKNSIHYKTAESIAGYYRRSAVGFDVTKEESAR